MNEKKKIKYYLFKYLNKFQQIINNEIVSINSYNYRAELSLSITDLEGIS